MRAAQSHVTGSYLSFFSVLGLGKYPFPLLPSPGEKASHGDACGKHPTFGLKTV